MVLDAQQDTRRRRTRHAGGRRAALVVALLLGPLVSPRQAEAQFDFLSTMFSRMEDLSLFAGVGGLLPSADGLAEERFGLQQFGMEVLFGISASEKWEFEAGVGYGQVFGLEERDPRIDLRGSVRDWPSVSVYGAHLETEMYLGVKSGMAELHGFQAYVDAGESDTTYQGSGRSVLFGLALGKYWEISGGDLNLLLELAYAFRSFPSIRWGDNPVPDVLPRRLNLTGWTLTGGIQFPIKAEPEGEGN